jgi:hypothetical protein
VLLIVQDGQGNLQTISAKGQEAVVDGSGSIAATGQSQTLLAANPNRSGWLMQNTGTYPMLINELGNPALSASWEVPAGWVFPPINFPLTINQLNISGTAGDTYTLRSW